MELDEPNRRFVEFALRVGGAIPSRLPFRYAAVVAAGRRNEAGAARAEMTRSGRFVGAAAREVEPP